MNTISIQPSWAALLLRQQKDGLGQAPVPAGGEIQGHYDSVCDAALKGAAIKSSVIMASRPSDEAAVCNMLFRDSLQSFH